jgi:HEAT repeat protein
MKNLLCVLMTLVAAVQARADEPIYAGKPLSSWVEALKSDNLFERGRACVALGEIGPGAKDAVPALAERVRDDPDARVRAVAALALGKIGPPAHTAAPALGIALKNENPRVRAAAALALGAIGPCEEVRKECPRLVLALLDGSSEAREAATLSLRELAPLVVPPLTQGLDHEDRTIRAFAAFALGKIGPKARDALPALREAATDDPDPRVRQAARQAVKQIGWEI